MATAYKTSPTLWLESQIVRGKNSIHAPMVELTPDLAALLLERNSDNRPLNRLRVEAYSSDILSGRWATNGESLVVSRDGLLNDGQHRCAAVIHAEKGINSIIVFGVDRESRKTTNMGKVKGAADFAAMDGLPYANIIAGMARQAIAFERGLYLSGGGMATTPVVLEYVMKNKDKLIASAQFVRPYQKVTGHMIAPTPLAFCHYTFSDINPAAADEYCHQIGSGELLVAGDPAFAVRNRLLQLKKARGPQIETIMHGWNAFRRGQLRTTLRVSGQMPSLV